MNPVSINLLKSMAQSVKGFVYLTKDEGMPLVKANLVEVNPSAVDPEDNTRVAARLTSEGQEFINNYSENNSKDNKMHAATNYAIIDSAVLPPSKRGNAKGGGAPVKYPFDHLQVGQSFFVPVSEEHPDPVKTLGSTVSSANMRYAEETGEKETKEVTKRGPGNRAVVDENGQKVREIVERPVYKFTRHFSLRAVEAGVKYGEWVAPDNGALIARIA